MKSVELFTESRTAWLATPDQIGFGLEPDDTEPYILTVLDYREA